MDPPGRCNSALEGGGNEGAGGGVAGAGCFNGEDSGGGGGGGAEGEFEPLPIAFRAACIAIDWLTMSLTDDCEIGGGGGVERVGGSLGAEDCGGGGAEGGVGAENGGRGAADGGSGGAAGGDGAAELGSDGTAVAGLREVMGGG